MSKRLLFLFNLHSGVGNNIIQATKLINGFSGLGYDTIAFSTEKPGDTGRKILEYKDMVEHIVCAGGDGTINEVASTLVGNDLDIPVTYIPTGTTNDLAASLNIPKNHLKAIDRVRDMAILNMDIGKFNDRFFDYVAAFGLLSDIPYTTDQNLKNTIGYAAYVLEVGKRLAHVQPVPVTVYGDNEQIYSGEFLYGMVTNTVQVAGMKNITGKNVRMDDGLFEVTLIYATENPIQFTGALRALLSCTEDPFVIRFKTSCLKVESQIPVSWTLDGEPGGAHLKVLIENINKAVRITVPKAKISQSERKD